MGPEPSRNCTASRAAVDFLSLAAAAGATADDARIARFPLVNRGPFTAILGVPSGWTDPTGPAAELTWDVASHALAEQAGDELVVLDGETHAYTLRLQRALGARWSVGLELPWITQGGGFMDPVIDAWHDAFGLDQGIRPALPTDDLQYRYARGGMNVYVLDDYAAGVGDVRTSAALRLVGAGGAPARLLLDLVADVEWPTGDTDRLTGSGGTDLSAGLRLARPLGNGTRVGWSASAGVTWPGEVDLPLPPPAGQVWYYDATVAWAALGSLDLLLQAQGQSGAWQSGLHALGAPALQLGGGAEWRPGRGYGLRLGIFEDIRTDTAPDFAMQLAVTWRPGT